MGLNINIVPFLPKMMMKNTTEITENEQSLRLKIVSILDPGLYFNQPVSQVPECVDVPGLPDVLLVPLWVLGHMLALLTYNHRVVFHQNYLFGISQLKKSY